MEEILLKLICEEYEMEEEYLFSVLRKGNVQEAMATMTYILVVKYDWKVSKVHKFYVTKGYNKTRSALYNQIKNGKKNLIKYEYSRIVLERIVDELEQSISNGTVVIEEDKELHLIRGRLITKLMSVDRIKDLYALENLLDKNLQFNFIKKKRNLE